MRINYKEKKLLSQEETNSQEVAFAVEDAKLQLQSDILATKKSLEAKKSELQDAKTAYPLNVEKIISLSSEIEGYEDGLKKLKSLQEELGFNL